MVNLIDDKKDEEEEKIEENEEGKEEAKNGLDNDDNEIRVSSTNIDTGFRYPSDSVLLVSIDEGNRDHLEDQDTGKEDRGKTEGVREDRGEESKGKESEESGDSGKEGKGKDTSGTKEERVKEEDKQETQETQEMNEEKPANNGTQLGTFEATAYTAFCDTGCTGMTATGVDVSNTIHHKGMRVVAVDPNVIPLNSVVEVSYGGQSFRAIAIDTGGHIKGNRIDLLVNSKDEAFSFGRRNIQVKLID